MSEASKQGRLFNSAVPGSWVTFPQRRLQSQMQSPLPFPSRPQGVFPPFLCRGCKSLRSTYLLLFSPLLSLPVSPRLRGRRHFHACPSHRSHPSPAGTSSSAPLTPTSITSPSVHKCSPHRHHLFSESDRILLKSSIRWENGQHKAGVGWTGIIQKKTGRGGQRPS